MFDQVVILLGEIRCLSLLGLKGLNINHQMGYLLTDNPPYIKTFFFNHQPSLGDEVSLVILIKFQAKNEVRKIFIVNCERLALICKVPITRKLAVGV